jgi:2',3'-cyclic-nucleotide 2'-phosphodiesterase/3'-nucleotidase
MLLQSYKIARTLPCLAYLKKLITIFILCFSFLFIPSLCLGNEASLTLIHTSNTLGEVEPCETCPESGNSGGLARRSHYIKTIKEERKELLILDGGDSLTMSYFSRESERAKALKRAEFVLRIYEKMGYDAINIGDTDLALGVDDLKTLQKKTNIPFISANLKEIKTGRAVFKPYFIREMNGIRIGILGLLTPDVPVAVRQEMKTAFVDDPVKVAMDVIKGPLSACDHIIALAHLNPFEIESLVKEIPKISVIIGGNDRYFMLPKYFQHTLYVQSDAFGSHIGRLNLNLLKGGNYTYEHFLVLMHPEMKFDPEIQNLINSSRTLLNRPLP